MSMTYYNGPLTICSGSQYRIRLEGKLRKLLGEERIVGPLEIPIRKCIERGVIDARSGEELIEISRFCDAAYTVPEGLPPTEETIKSWSEVIEALRLRRYDRWECGVLPAKMVSTAQDTRCTDLQHSRKWHPARFKASVLMNLPLS